MPGWRRVVSRGFGAGLAQYEILSTTPKARLDHADQTAALECAAYGVGSMKWPGPVMTPMLREFIEKSNQLSAFSEEG